MTVLAGRRTLYYGWIIVSTLAFTEMTSWGVLYYGFSVMVRPLQQETGWDTATVTGAFSLALLVSGLTGLVVGRWLDRRGARALMTLGSCAAALLVLAWSHVTTPATFYGVWLLMGVVMATVLYEPAFTIIANWFVRKRAAALTVLTIGGGLASVVYVPLAQRLTSAFGWRSALDVLAALLAVLTIPLHALVLRRRPADIGALPDGEPVAASAPTFVPHVESLTVRTATRSAPFWWLTAGFSLSTFASIAISVHLLPYLDERGFTPLFAAGVVSLMGGSQIPARIIFTPLSARLSPWLLTAGLFGLQGIALLILMVAPTEAGVLAFAFLFGAGGGGSTPARASLLAELVGPLNYGSISGVQALVMTLARALGPVGIGALVVASRSYQPALLLLTLALAGSVGSVLRAGAHLQSQSALSAGAAASMDSVLDRDESRQR